jgi:TonB family protein
MNKALTESFIIHGVFAAFFIVLTNFSQRKAVETFSFDIVEKSAVEIKKNQKVVINATPAAPIKKKSVLKTREVFGVKRKTLTSEKGTFIAKVGNTVTKKEDDKALLDSESDSLPEPAEEFLITSMPRAITEIRPIYPTWAKEQKISGAVVFEILIDQNGDVRQAKLLRGLNPKLDQLAKEAMIKFKFKPAFIDKKPAPVRIKYAIKYILES